MLNTTVYLHVDCIAKSPQYGSNFVIPRASKHVYNISIGVTLLAMELKLRKRCVLMAEKCFNSCIQSLS